ncbi:uncharacterized protein LOC113311209 [Papaver somniferum]|uniref:uncharacterized protein LOC113311209 n=1 Tax=Papaver somniferum TaxID=3469 RepID=UPI000E702FFC|nr:uncharacterized protein LOC113311209 [Papaver somniferum]
MEVLLMCSSRMTKKIGRKKIQIDLEMMSLIPFGRRTNIRSTTKAFGMSKTTVWRRIKDGSIKAHSNAIKPGFSLKTRIARLKHCLEMLDESVSPAVFSGMYDRIHIDEKWFYMSKTTQKYYLHPMEAPPVRRCTSKNFIPKVMFLSALARPRYDEYVNTPFDGKIGMWAFIFMEAAKRKSKNRVADNARPHIAIGDEQFCEAVRQFGLDARICFQPPNSPDLNVNDLGYFRSIDEHQHSKAPNTVPELVAGVEKSFRECPSYLINNVFLTLQTCMNEILKKKGDNDYYIPHMKKDHLIRIGELPTCIQCDSEVITAAKEALQAPQHQLYQQENETPHE